MRNVLMVALVGLVSACGMSSDKFATEFALEFCAVDATCNSTPYTDEADCVANLGIGVALLAEVCDYDGGSAKTCLNELADTQCDTDGRALEPASCDAVFTNCADLGDTDEPADTDAPGDTDA